MHVPLSFEPERVVVGLGPFSSCASKRLAFPMRCRFNRPSRLATSRAGFGFAPEMPLRASATCAVRAQGGFIRGYTRPGLVGWFRVASVADTTPPTFEVAEEGEVWASRDDGASCQDGSGHAWVALDQVEDDTTAESQLLFLVWIQPGARAVDPNVPATTFLEADRHRGKLKLLFDGGGLCSRGGTVPFPSLGEHVRIGLRAVDLAGRMGPLRELGLDGTPTAWQSESLSADTTRVVPKARLLRVSWEPASATVPPKPWGIRAFAMGGVLMAMTVVWMLLRVTMRLPGQPLQAGAGISWARVEEFVSRERACG